MRRTVFVLVGILLIMSGSAFAETNDVESAIAAQQKQIDKAIAKGSLTKQEIDIVQDNLTKVKERQVKMKADGKLGEGEKSSLLNILERNGKMIEDKKNHPVRPVNKPDVEFRISNQQKRIDKGISSGDLTKAEANLLQDNLTTIKQRVANMKKDRKFTEAEEEKIHEYLDRNSKMIEDKKNNPASRFNF